MKAPRVMKTPGDGECLRPRVIQLTEENHHMRNPATGKRGVARAGLSAVVALAAVGTFGTASFAAGTTVTQQVLTPSSATGPVTGSTVTLTLPATASPKFSSGFVGVQVQSTTATAAATATCATNPSTSASTSATAASVKFISTTKVAVTLPDMTSITGTSSYVLICAYGQAAASGVIPTTATVTGKANFIVATAPTLNAAGGSPAGIVPATGPAVGGQLVTINGTGFPTSIAAGTPLSATLGGDPLTNITPINSTSFTAITPARPASATAVTLSVTTNGGTITRTLMYTYKNGVTVSPNTVPAGVSVDVDVQGTGFNNLTFTTTDGTSVNAAGAHVYVVAGTYNATGFVAATTDKTKGETSECVNVAVISDNELICTIDASKSVTVASHVYTYGATALTNGAYTVTVVDDGSSASPAYQTVLSSGATFTVADF
jgi:IPT/TIG domain